jgi:NAD(P)-dependent dehydrogenase (short-subunit alcohol dehydrogenase family)
MDKLEGKVAIVTGGAAGIGKATALLFAEEGANVIVADRDEENGRRVAEQIIRSGGKGIFLPVDVSRPDEVEAMVRTVVETYGRLDVLHNNAGVEGERAPTADCTLENWDRVIGINLRGVFLGMKYGIPAMVKQGGGSIINTASVAGLVGVANMPAYCASKGGIIQLTKAAALEYRAQGIRVNVICPGGVQTPMLERIGATTAGNNEGQAGPAGTGGRVGQPEEIARLALFLASDDSSYCNGAPFAIDGGFVAG